MSEPATSPKGAGKRLPTPEDLPGLFEAMGAGSSVRAYCQEHGIDPSSMSKFVNSDEVYPQYARAREERGETLAEQVLAIGRAAMMGEPINGKRIDHDGARMYIDGIKWRAGQMSPKTGDVKIIRHDFGDLSDEELAARIAARERGE